MKSLNYFYELIIYVTVLYKLQAPRIKSHLFDHHQFRFEEQEQKVFVTLYSMGCIPGSFQQSRTRSLNGRLEEEGEEELMT